MGQMDPTTLTERQLQHLREIQRLLKSDPLRCIMQVFHNPAQYITQVSVIHNITSSRVKLPAPGEEPVHFYLNLSEYKADFLSGGLFPLITQWMQSASTEKTGGRPTLSESVEGYFFSFSVTLSLSASSLPFSPSTSHLLFKEKFILLALAHGLVCTLIRAL